MRNTFDVLVVGGGIIGASAAQHAACAGYSTLLVEQGDYASGTSSRTSRMHNCGFMYFLDAHESLLRFLLRPVRLLKSLELARRTMRERAHFVRTSPDRVRKLEFHIPFTADGTIRPWHIRAAASLLQALGGSAVSLEPEFLGPKEARAHPLLGMTKDAGRLRGTFRFAEYQYAWPERIVVDTILKGREAGLDARNYTRLVALSHENGMWTAVLEADGARYSVTAKAVINAAGAWVDHVTALAGMSAPPLNVGAKGVNLLVKLPDAARGYGMETVTASGGPFYVMPWGDFHYIGPADAPADAATTEFRARGSEIESILRDANALFPGLGLTNDDVVYSWAGVRPRTRSKDEPLGSLDVREHDLSRRGLPHFIVFTGGLIMTHRDAGRRLLKAVRRHVAPSGPARPVDYALAGKADENRVTRTSVRRAVEDEQARTVSDILRRRLSVGWEPDLGVGSAVEAARLAGELLGWSEEDQMRQVEAYRTEIERSFRPRNPSAVSLPVREAAQ